MLVEIPTRGERAGRAGNLSAALVWRRKTRCVGLSLLGVFLSRLSCWSCVVLIIIVIILLCWVKNRLFLSLIVYFAELLLLLRLHDLEPNQPTNHLDDRSINQSLLIESSFAQFPISFAFILKKRRECWTEAACGAALGPGRGAGDELQEERWRYCDSSQQNWVCSYVSVSFCFQYVLLCSLAWCSCKQSMKRRKGIL
jgi:hypothetical protein